MKYGAKPRNLKHFYDRCFFSCLFAGEQSNGEHRCFLSLQGENAVAAERVIIFFEKRSFLLCSGVHKVEYVFCEWGARPVSNDCASIKTDR